MEETPLALKLREARKQRFDTQKEAAEAVGCDETAMSLYETGKRVPDPIRLMAMCRVYGIDFNRMAQIAYQATV